MKSYNQIFILFAFACILGIFTANILRDIEILAIIFFLLIILFINFYIFLEKYMFPLLALSLGIFLGFFFSVGAIAEHKEKEDIIGLYDNHLEHEVEIMINTVYKQDDFDIRYTAKLEKIDGGKIEEDIDVLFETKTNFSFEKGTILKFSTLLERVENFNDTFNYKSYLESKNIYALIYSHDFQNIGLQEVSIFDRGVIGVRNKMLQIIKQIYPRDQAVFLGGILIGARENLPTKLSKAFNNSGLTHLIAVSGYNITIIIVFLSYVFSYIPKILRIAIITGFLIFYTAIVGDSAAVIRATLMGLVGYYVLMSGRAGDSLAIILFTGILMLVYNPFLMNYDIGFQLSFLAVFGLLYTQGFFEKIFFFLPKKFAIKESFVLTLSAFTFTIPIMVFNFGQISVLAPIANMLVGWSIPFAMLFGFLSVLGYILSPFVGYLIGFFEFFLLQWTTSVAYMFGSFDFALLQFDLGKEAIYLQFLYFLVAISGVLYFR